MGKFRALGMLAGGSNQARNYHRLPLPRFDTKATRAVYHSRSSLYVVILDFRSNGSLVLWPGAYDMPHSSNVVDKR